jgi:hypothetical protein
MSSFQVVAEKVAQVGSLTAGFVSPAAAGLGNKAESLSLEEMSGRLDGALRALRGEDVSTSGAVTTQKPSLWIAQEMLGSYEFNRKTGVSTFAVPPGVTDVEAMSALNEYFRRNLPNFKRDAVYAGDLDWYEKLPKQYSEYCQKRDYSQARQISITGIVKGTEGGNRATEEGVLKKKSLVFADPRDQTLAAAIHACKYNGEDLFKDLRVRGSFPGFVLSTDPFYGARVGWYHDVSVAGSVAASGSPSPESK